MPTRRGVPNSALPGSNYYTPCGMSEYMGPSTESQPDGAVSPDPLATSLDPPVTSGRAVRRTLIGPFTARQLGLMNGVVVGIALLLFAATRPLGGERTTTVTPGASFFRLAAETRGLQVGQRAPDFVGSNGGEEVRLSDLDGRELSLAEFAGRPVWVFFWATWCPPCQQETPDIRAAFEAHRDEGLVIVAIDIQEPAESVREYATRYGLSYTIALDSDAAIMRIYGVFGLPTHYFIDRDGIIRDRYFGPLSRDEIEERIELISEP